MELEALLTTILVPASLLCAAWLCLPDILILLGRRRIERGILGGPEAVSQHTHQAPADLVQQITELGFAPLGVSWETMPGHKMFHEVVLVAHKGDCYATVYRLFENDPPRVAFFSALTGGASILTQNYPGGMEAKEDTLRAGTLDRESPEPVSEPVLRLPLTNVLEEHRHRIANFALRGHTPVRTATMEDFLEGQRIYSAHPAVANCLRGASLVLLPIKLVFLSILPLIVAADVGVAHPATWAALALSCLGLIAFRHYGFPLIAGLSRATPSLEAEEKN